MTIPEAWIAGKPTVQCLLGNAENEGPGMDATRIGLPPVKTIEDFLGEIEESLDANTTSIKYGTLWYGERFQYLRFQYLKKWLGPMLGSAARIAKSIKDLLDSKQPKTWKEPNYQDWVEIHGVLVQHSRDHAKPEADII